MSDTTTSTPLLRARPSEVGVPAAAVHALLDGVEAAGLEMHSLMVVRRGRVAAEGWWAPCSADRVHLLYSLSKSFTSTAVGFGIARRFRWTTVSSTSCRATLRTTSTRRSRS